jgi:hypothetical protein
LAVHEGQPDRVRASEVVAEVARATGQQRRIAGLAEAGGLAPRRVGDFEFVPTGQVDVEVVGVATVLEGELVQRGPVVHAAT